MVKEIALLSPIFVTFFWGMVFFIQIGERDKARNNLGVFMALAFLLYCSHAVFFSHRYCTYALIECIYIFSMLSLYPMYYIYLRLLTEEKLTLGEQLVHFIPALVFSVIAFVTTLLLDSAELVVYVKHILMKQNLKGIRLENLLGFKACSFLMARILFLIQVVFYVVRGIELSKKHNLRIENQYSNTEGKTLNWVRIISVAILLISIASVTFTFIGRSYFTRNEVSLIIPSGIFTAFLFFIGLKGNSQNRIPTFREEHDCCPNESDSNDYDSEENSKVLGLQIKILFEMEKVYQNPDLRIQDITIKLKTNRTYVSKSINAEFGKNFNDFVNSYRVEEAKKLLENNGRNRYTIDHIAELSGFGSVQSFSRVFKKKTGYTPGNYFQNKVKENPD